MKKILLAIIITTAISICYGQVPLKINDMNMPTSPAFVLLEKSPSSIEKPSNPKAFAVSLINVWQNNGALEFAPYWFKNRPAYTFDDNLKKKAPIFQTFGISAATAKTDSIRNLSVGFRTQLLRLYSDIMKNTILSLKNKIVDLLSVEDPEDIDLNEIKKAKDSLHNLQSKVTFNTELAAAYMGESSTSKDLASTKAGVWLNIRWTPYKFPLDFVLLARYSWATGANSKSGKDSAFFDYGINLSYQDKEKNFDVQLEYVNRRDYSAQSNYDHFALVANYQIIPGIVAVASIGKEFKAVNNVFALLGVKFGISKELAQLNR
ncbi:MAG TPA: hypothetical protein VFZ33_14955 [Chitinophagaceae bacterium]